MARPLVVTRTPVFPALWICASAWIVCSGWLLSLAHQLSAAGYAVALGSGIAAFLIAWKNGALENFTAPSLHRIKRRIRLPLPLAFFILAALAFLGGALYAPANYDGLAYRTPRVLHWLAEGRWHWIHSDFARLNTRAPNFEWMCAPLIALTKTDRFFFLINFLPFLLMPGLVFGVFVQLGVRKKVAWRWMWIVPTGYCFLLQAGSIANDLPGALFALAAIDFALRAKRAANPHVLWLSILAAALMSGTKTSNLPLLLPWLVAAAPSLPLLLRAPLKSACVCIFAAGASLLPCAAMNVKYCGDWSGLAIEGASMRGGNKAVYFAWNAIMLPVQNLAPPVFPFAGPWNRTVDKAIPPSVAEKVGAMFESTGAHLTLGEMQIEEEAGLGFGVTLLVLASFAAGWKKRLPTRGGVPRWTSAVLAAPFVSLFAFMLQSGLSGGGRLITPYYALLVPALLISPAQERVVQTKWWKRSAALVFFLALVVLILQPARPLWPANFFLEKMRALQISPSLVARAESVYSVYRRRPYAFAPALAALPPDATTLGIISFDDPETSLWKPFGSRRIEHVRPGETDGSLQERHIRYVLISSETYARVSGKTVDDWVKSHHAEVLKIIPLRLKVTNADHPQAASLHDWVLVKIPEAGTARP